MAELLLKIGPGSNYIDGNPVCATHDLAVEREYVWRICFEQDHESNTLLRSKGGYLPISDVAYDWGKACRQYEFVRDGRWGVIRKNLVEGTEELFKNPRYRVWLPGEARTTITYAENIFEAAQEHLPNNVIDRKANTSNTRDKATGAYKKVLHTFNKLTGKHEPITILWRNINKAEKQASVGTVVDRLAKAKKFAIFNDRSNATWFGGRHYLGQENMLEAWSAIEVKCPHTRDMYQPWRNRLSQVQLKHFVALPVYDFTDEQCAEFLRPMYQCNDSGEKAWECWNGQSKRVLAYSKDEPELEISNSSWSPVIKAKRELVIPYLDMLKPYLNQIRDRRCAVDVRDSHIFNVSDRITTNELVLT